MAKNTSSDRAQQVGQTIRATADLPLSKRTTAVDTALNGGNTGRK